MIDVFVVAEFGWRFCSVVNVHFSTRQHSRKGQCGALAIVFITESTTGAIDISFRWNVH
jgi:hypothetical protein